MGRLQTIRVLVELGKEGLEEYLVSKHILTNTNPEPVDWFSK